LHYFTLVVICVVRLLFVLFYVLFVCKCVLPPGDNPIAVNKCIIHIIIKVDLKRLADIGNESHHVACNAAYQQIYVVCDLFMFIDFIFFLI